MTSVPCPCHLSSTRSRDFRRRCKCVDRLVTALLLSHPSLMKISAAPHSNILLVDDNQDGLLVRKALLEELGYCVQIASTGEEGLKLFEVTNFDVVVTDYRMPGVRR